MKRFMLASAALLAVFACASQCRAAAPLPPAPTQGWCYDTVSSTGYSGVRACEGVIPPPSVDPLAMTNVLLQYSWRPCSQKVVNLSQLSDVASRNSGTDLHPNFTWPFKNSSFGFTKAHGRHWAADFSLPLNPGTLRHALKGVTYANCFGTPSIAPIVWKVEPLGTTPRPAGTCNGTSPMNNGSFVNFDPTNHQPPYPTFCNLAPGGMYRLTIDTASGINDTALWIFTWTG
jgi:hypothetical protein